MVQERAHLSGAHMPRLDDAHREAARFIASGVGIGCVLGLLCGLVAVRGERRVHHR